MEILGSVGGVFGSVGGVFGSVGGVLGSVLLKTFNTHPTIKTLQLHKVFDESSMQLDHLKMDQPTICTILRMITLENDSLL